MKVHILKVQMMKREGAGAVPMRMRWVHGEVMIRMQSTQNTMEIYIGGSARRATGAIWRP